MAEIPSRTSNNISFEVNRENDSPELKMRQWRQIYEVKNIPQTADIIESDV